MSTNFRDALKQLLSAIEGWLAEPTPSDSLPCAMENARAVLAQPEAEGPTDEELNDLCADHGFLFDDGRVEGLSILSDIVKDVLARWGRPAPQPLPAAERLPQGGQADG